MREAEELFKKDVEDYKSEIIKSIDKNNDQFEKQFAFIAGGTLAGSFLLIEKIIPISSAICRQYIEISWGFLGLSLIANMLSFFIAARMMNKNLKEFMEKIAFTPKMANRIKYINISNLICIVIYGIGIVFLSIFVVINFNNMDKKVKSDGPQSRPIPDYNKKGYVPSTPPPSLVQPQPVSNQPQAPQSPPTQSNNSQ